MKNGNHFYTKLPEYSKISRNSGNFLNFNLGVSLQICENGKYELAKRVGRLCVESKDTLTVISG
jgi:hypothetical protein